MKPYTKEELEDEVVFYCTQCGSLDVRYGNKNILYCHSCGCGPEKLDVTTMYKWERIYRKINGRGLWDDEPEYLSDLRECYLDEAREILTETEALNCGLKTRDVINKKED